MVNRTDELTYNSRNLRPTMSEDSDDPDLIRMQIEQTRAHMGQTIDQIQDRLSPKRLRQQAGEAIREATIGKVEQMTDKVEYEMKSWRTKITQTIKENPIPAALIGIGVGWLIVSDKEPDYPYVTDQYYYDPEVERYGYRRQEGQSSTAEIARESREWAREKAEEVKERAGMAAQKVQDRVSSVTDSVQESARETFDEAERRAKELGQQIEETAEEAQIRARQTAARLENRTRQSVRRTKQSFLTTMNENPLAVGVGAMAVGALVGAALPSTAAEDRLMGERRDYLVDEAKERAQETTEKVKTVAREAKDAAVETAKEEAEKQGLQPVSESESEL